MTHPPRRLLTQAIATWKDTILGLGHGWVNVPPPSGSVTDRRRHTPVLIARNIPGRVGRGDHEGGVPLEVCGGVKLLLGAAVKYFGEVGIGVDEALGLYVRVIDAGR